MKKSVRIFEFLKFKIHSKEFVEEHKLHPKAFLRCRLLPFSIIFLFILNLLRRSIPKELNSFCKNIKIEKTTRSAVTQARAKISPSAFVELNDVLIEQFYEDNDYFTYKNFILLAIDGSSLQLPETQEILDKYGGMTNNTLEIMPGARISILYDVLNKIILHACLKPYKSDEREMAIEHIEALKALNIDLNRLLIIFDRGYPSIALMHYLSENGINFLIRCGTGFVKEINEVLKSKKRDQLVTITPKRLKKIPKSKLELDHLGLEVEGDIVFRVVIVKLKTGEKEILLTSLLCKKSYPYSIFQELYFKRWGIEEGYKFIKTVEIENFSGKSILAVEQDFHATVLIANSHALLMLEAEEEMKKQQKDFLGCSDQASLEKTKVSFLASRKYEYCVNKNVSFEALKNEFVSVLLDSHSDIEKFCKEIKKLMKCDLIPKRPGRSFRRLRRNTRRKYHMNQR